VRSEQVKATRLRRRELEVLAAAARVVMTERDRARLSEALRQPLDWDVLLAAAEAHGIAVLLHRHLQELEGAAIPPETLSRLNRLAFEATARGLAASRQLQGVLAMLGEQGIAVVPLKGPLLALSIYGNLALRGTSYDLDIAVAEADFERTLALFLARGYSKRALSETDHGTHGHGHRDPGEVDLLAPAGGVLLDLHTRLVGNLHTTAMSMPEVLARTEERELLGMRVRLLAPEDQLLYLCLHGAKHMFARLLWIADVAEVLRASPALRWPQLIASADTLAARRRLALGVFLAWKTLGADVPAEVRNTLFRDRALPALYALVMRRLTVSAGGTVPPTLASIVAGEMAVRESWSQRRSYLASNIRPNERDAGWLSVRPGLAWLRYLLRPLRLIQRHAVRPMMMRLQARRKGEE
jgi:Uncharacterised nucleotidyltransferase